MAKYFPMFIDISNWRILMVGGGKIAARRVKTLSRFASAITVIAPETQESLEQLEREGKICLLKRAFQDTDILDHEWNVVFAATDQPKINERVAKMCHDKKIPFNRSDCKEKCDFFFPSIIESDGVVIGINSGGDDPGKVKRMRKRIEAGLE